MNIDTIMTRGVSTMKNKLPPFLEIYRALIATPSISATEEALDQSNADLITLLADWFKNLGFNVEVQPVPELATNLICWPVADRGLAACCWRGIPIRYHLMTVAGRAIRLH